MLLLLRCTGSRTQRKTRKLSPPFKIFDSVFYEPCLSPFYNRPSGV
nr:MAG TPA: hypothetical protein [Caudoviricetes sp.]